MLSKKLLVPVFAVVVAGSTLLGVSTNVHAQAGNNPLSGLAQAIASKLGVDQSKVQDAITAYMQQQKGNRQQNIQQMEKKRLDQLVNQGKITGDQETAILGELSTLQSKYGPSSMKGKTQAQRQQAMQDRKNAITTWANSQNPKIDPSYIMPFGGGHRGGWHKPTGTSTPTQ